MKSPRGRNLNLADAMILVAATAVGLSIVPSGWTGWLGDAIAGRNPGYLYGLSPVPRFNIHQLRRVLALGVNPTWLAWTYALLIIRLRNPRPSRRKLARQPGMMASCSAALMTTFGLIVNMYRNLSLYPDQSFREAFAYLDGFAGPAVIVAWLTLCLGQRWRFERGPIDALGRILGVGWVAMYLIGWGILLFFR